MGCCTSTEDVPSSTKEQNNNKLIPMGNDTSSTNKQQQQQSNDTKSKSAVVDENNNDNNTNNAKKDDPFAVDEDSLSPPKKDGEENGTAPPSPEKQGAGDHNEKEIEKIIENVEASQTFEDLVKEKTEVFLKEEEQKQEEKRKDIERKEEKVELAKEQLNQGIDAFLQLVVDDDDNNANKDEKSSSGGDPLMQETKEQVVEFKQLLDKLKAKSSSTTNVGSSTNDESSSSLVDAEKATHFVTQISSILQEVAASEAASKITKKHFSVVESEIKIEEETIQQAVKETIEQEKKTFLEQNKEEFKALSAEQRQEKIKEFETASLAAESSEKLKAEVVAKLQKQKFEQLKQEHEKQQQQAASNVVVLTEEEKREKLQQVARLIKQSKEVIEISSKERKIKQDQEEFDRKKKIESIKNEARKQAVVQIHGEGSFAATAIQVNFNRQERVREARETLQKGLATIDVLSQGDDMMLLLACKDECEELALVLDQLGNSEEGIEDSDKASTLVQKVGTLLQQLAKEDFAESEKMEKQRKVGTITQLVAASRNCIKIAAEERAEMNEKAKELEAAKGVKQFTDVDSLPEAPQSSNGSPSNTGRTGGSRGNSAAGTRKKPGRVVNDWNSNNDHGEPQMLENLLYSPPNSDEDDDDTLDKKKQYFEEMKRRREAGKLKPKPKPKGKLGASNRLYDPNRKNSRAKFAEEVEESAAAKRKKYAQSLPPPSPKRSKRNSSSNNSSHAGSPMSLSHNSSSLRNGGGSRFGSSYSAAGSPTQFSRRSGGGGSSVLNNHQSSFLNSPSNYQKPKPKHDRSLISNLFGGSSNNNRKSRNNNSSSKTVGGGSVTMRNFGGGGARAKSLMSNYNPVQVQEDKRKRQWGAKPVNVTKKTIATRRHDYSESIRMKHQEQRERFGSVAGASNRKLIENSQSHYSQGRRRGATSSVASYHNSYSRSRAGSRRSNHQQQYQQQLQQSFCSSNQIYPTFQNQHSRGDFSHQSSQTGPGGANFSSEETILQLMHSVRLIKSKGFADMPLDARSHVVRMVRDNLMNCKMQVVNQQRRYEGTTGEEDKSNQNQSTLNFLASVEKVITAAEKGILKTMMMRDNNNNNNGNNSFKNPLASGGRVPSSSSTMMRNQSGLNSHRLSPSPTIDLGAGAPRGLLLSPTSKKKVGLFSGRTTTTRSNNSNNNMFESADFAATGGAGGSPSGRTSHNGSFSPSSCLQHQASREVHHQNVSAILEDTSKILSDLRDGNSPIRALLSCFRLIMSPDFELKSMPYERDQMLRLFQAQLNAAKKYTRTECGPNSQQNERRNQLNDLLERVWMSVASVHFPQKLKMMNGMSSNTANSNKNTKKKSFLSVQDQESWMYQQQQRNAELGIMNNNNQEQHDENGESPLPHQTENDDVNSNNTGGDDLSTKAAKNDDQHRQGENRSRQNSDFFADSDLGNNNHSPSSFSPSSTINTTTATSRNHHQKRRNYFLIQEINESLLDSRRMLCAPSFSILNLESQQQAFEVVQEQIDRAKLEFQDRENGQFDINTESRVNQLQVVLNAMRDKLMKRREELERFRQEEEAAMRPKDNTNNNNNNSATAGASSPQTSRTPVKTSTAASSSSIMNKGADRYSKSSKLQPVAAWGGVGGASKLGGFASSHWMFSPKKTK